MGTYCPKCGAELPAEAGFCPRCGQALQEELVTQEEPHLGIILMMWALTLGYFGFAAAKVPALVALCGMPSFFMSIWLVFQKNVTDRTNGWIRLGISLTVGIITFMELLQRQQ